MAHLSGFNLRIESLVIEREIKTAYEAEDDTVSISELRVLLLRDGSIEEFQRQYPSFQSQN